MWERSRDVRWENVMGEGRGCYVERLVDGGVVMLRGW